MPFFLWLVLVIGIVVSIEEGPLENLYFPDTKGRSFFGSVHNLFDVLPTVFILSGFKFAWDALRKQKEVETLKDAVKEGELQFLKSQINPHFLFNNLNNLYSHAIKNSPDTPQIILNLSEVLRYMLYECKAAKVPLSREIAQINHFISLGKLQIENRGVVHFQPTGNDTGYMIAPLILMVFIENAFKHSASSQSSEIEINITTDISTNGILQFQCRNSYHQQSNTEKLSKGIGLENVKTRLELLYPKAHKLAIRKDDHSFEITLSLNLI